MPEPAPIRPGHVPPDAYARFVSAVADYAMFFLDPEGRVSTWNPGAERMKGWTEKEILGEHFSIFFPPEAVRDRKPQFELKVAAQEGHFEEENWRVRKDGTMFWANVVVTPVRASDGRLLGFAKVTRDLTSRKHAEDALRASEERFRLLVESVKDYAIFMLDPQGRIVSWNAGARRLKGYEAEEIIGEHFRKFYLPDDVARKHPEHELEIAVREGRYEEEGWRVRKDGSVFWANVTITAMFDSTGRHVGFGKVTRDLTSRKHAEEDLRQRAMAYASLNRELDAFSHTVAHDLRAPIRAIEHLASVLLEEEGPRLSEEGRSWLEAMHGSAVNMATLVSDLLDFSTAAGREPRREDVDVTALARGVAAELTSASPERAEIVRVAEGLRARADGHLLRIVLVNVLANALKFTRNVAQPRIEVGHEETARGPAFFVRDNGVGFDAEDAPRLFKPFSRLESARTFEGTGIGLATVARIVERHGGSAWAQGRPGEGATIYFTLGEGSDAG